MWGGEKVWLIALLLGFLAMLFEAIAWHGLDNLVLPLASFLLLRSYLKLDPSELVARVAITSVLVAVALMYQRRTTLAGSALLGAVLVGYLSWTLGGWPWLLPPLLFFISYKLLPTGREDASRRSHNFHAVLCVSSAGLAWLFLSALFHQPDLLFPYTLAFSAHLAITGLVRLKRAFPARSTLGLLSASVLVGWMVLFVPVLLTENFTHERLALSLATLVGVAVATGLFALTQPGMDDCPTNTPRWLRQATSAALGSLLGLVPIYIL